MAKIRLSADQRMILEELAEAPEEGGWVYVIYLQRATVWPIRPPLDSLARRRLVEWKGSRSDLTGRFWRITDAGREALR